MVNTSVFTSFPVLTTRRLVLREIRPSDAPAIFEMRTNGRINQFIARETMRSLEDAEDLVTRTIQAFQDKQGIGWAGLVEGSNQLIGTCGFNHIDYPNLRAEIGGELSTDFWGKHLALEAVTEIVKFGFETLKLHSIEARVDPTNRGAIFLLSKLGFQREALFRDRIFFNGSFRDLAVYAFVANSWKSED